MIVQNAVGMTQSGGVLRLEMCGECDKSRICHRRVMTSRYVTVAIIPSQCLGTMTP